MNWNEDVLVLRVMEVEFEDFVLVPLEVSLEVHNFVIRFYY